jgi:pilus assembly protein Flp/PilA
MLENLERLWMEEDAPTAVEYAVMLLGIAVVIIGAVKLLGSATNSNFEKANAVFQK